MGVLSACLVDSLILPAGENWVQASKTGNRSKNLNFLIVHPPQKSYFLMSHGLCINIEKNQALELLEYDPEKSSLIFI
ncbi:MAG: hypothetical protein AB1798_08195 [Spirochaetota bacterium]